MSDTITIDDGVPMPPRQNPSRRGGYAEKFRQLEVGQSLVYRGRGHITDLRRLQQNASTAAHASAPRKKFETRLVTEDGERVVRVWRVA